MKSLEFGYKGVFNKRLSVGFDIYYLEQKGNAGFQQISPVTTIVGLEGALGQGVQTATQPQIEALLIVQTLTLPLLLQTLLVNSLTVPMPKLEQGFFKNLQLLDFLSMESFQRNKLQEEMQLN
ncbi:hypothetical protein N9483_01320 [Flavobacteriaceae bacterium]|nr:hypothetical protein [Flavobacteriaceae bacterium]